jgi:HEAT repeat protein
MKGIVLFAVVLMSGPPCARLGAEEKREPRYQGKPLPYWVERLRKAESEEQRYEAATALKEFRPDAVPAIPDLLEMLDDRSKSFRELAGSILANMGPAAKSAAPALIRMLKEKTARSPEVVIDILGHINPDPREAVPLLTALMHDPKQGYQAVIALGQMGPPAKEAVPNLIKALEDPEVDAFAVFALCAIHASPKTVLPALRRTIRAGRAKERLDVSVIREVGNFGEDAVPLLIEFLDEKDPSWRQTSAEVLGELGPKAKQGVPALLKALRDHERDIPVEAARALWQIDRNLAGVPVLAEFIRVGTVSGSVRDLSIALNAARLLGNIGPAAKSALPQLEQAASYDFVELRKAAAEAIGKIAGKSAPDPRDR